MASIKREASLTLDKEDVAAILTEDLCRYNAFAGLEVTIISQNTDGDFDLVLSPKPEEKTA